MALHQGWGVNSVSIDAPDVRLANAGLLVRDTAHVVRSGVLSVKARTLVTGRSDMKVDVAQFSAAFSRNAAYGAMLFGNDGTTQVTIDTAPTSNSRIDVVYVVVPDTTQGDAAAAPSFAVSKGTAAATPVKPTIPASGLELATVQIPSTATTTTSANVVITQTHKYTTVQGGRIPFRNLADINAETLLPEGTLAYLDVAPQRTYRFDGAAWRLWEQAPTEVTLTVPADGGTKINIGTTGSALFVASVSAGIARLDFRIRPSGTGVAWGDIRYTLPFPAYSTFGLTAAAGMGVTFVNDLDGGAYLAGSGAIGDGSWRVWRTGADFGSSATWATSAPFTITGGDTITGFITYPAA